MRDLFTRLLDYENNKTTTNTTTTHTKTTTTTTTTTKTQQGRNTYHDQDIRFWYILVRPSRYVHRFAPSQTDADSTAEYGRPMIVSSN